MRRAQTGMIRFAVPLACMTALAGTAIQAPAAHASAARNWRSYVMAPPSPNAEPVRASVLSGDVRNPHGVVASNGVTTLTVAPGGAPATLLIDYGKEVVGIPYLDVKSHTGPETACSSPSAKLANTCSHLATRRSRATHSRAPERSRWRTPPRSRWATPCRSDH